MPNPPPDAEAFAPRAGRTRQYLVSLSVLMAYSAEARMASILLDVLDLHDPIRGCRYCQADVCATAERIVGQVEAMRSGR